LLGLSVLVSVTVAQTPDPNKPFRTFGEMNGRAWRGFSLDIKTAYLEGVNAALGEAVVRTLETPCEAQGKGVFDAHRAIGFTRGETIEGIDRFYDQPENLLITIIDALEIVSAKARGVPHDVIEAKISARRRAANEAPERK